VNGLDLSLIAPALLAGALVLSTHVPLGHEVLKRGIIFIDLAIAQIAALGVIAAIVFGGELANWQIQVFASLSALLGAGLIYGLEQRHKDSLEAIIGILFVLAASGGLILVSYAPHSDELLHDLLVGQILWASTQQLIWISALYIPLLLIWFKFKHKHQLIFYPVFSLAVTASVQLVGIYLVFASLILPALACRMIQQHKLRLIYAYSLGLLGYVLGIFASIVFDLPTGAIIVWTLLVICLLSQPVLNHHQNLLK
jgi:zinc/manganese transport system permease protein